MSQVTSRDGTSIAYDRRGSGPAVILVGGGLIDPATGRAGRSENAPLAAELASHFSVYNYDRRGRAESGDTLPYAVEREIEDIEALIGHAGGSVRLYGVSSGGALALDAVAAGLPVDSVAVYEVPYSVGEDASQRWQNYVEELRVVLAEGRRGVAVELFMRLAGASEDDIAGAKDSTLWPALEAIAHTLPTMRPAWEMASRRQRALPRSLSPSWCLREEAMTSSSRPRTQSSGAFHTVSAAPSMASLTRSTPRRWLRCSAASSEVDMAALCGAS